MALQVLNVRDEFASAEQRTIKMLVAGNFGAGKTRTASTWPNVIYADAEGRMLSVRDRDVRRVPIVSVQDLEELKSCLDQKPGVRAKMLDGPVETVVIDTVDEVSRIIIRERLRSEKLETMRPQDWGFLGDTLRNLIRGYRNLTDVNVIFNVHIKSTEDSETGRVEYVPAIQGAMGSEIGGYVDEALLIVARPAVDPATGERVIARYFQTYPDAQHDWVKDHSGALPQEFPINFNDDYQRLAGAIFGDIPAPAVSTPPPAESAPPRKKRGRPAKVQPDPVVAQEPDDQVQAATADAAPAREPEPAPEPVAEQYLASRFEDPVQRGDYDKAAELVTQPAPVEPETVPDAGTPDEPDEDPLADLDQVERCTECGKVVEAQDYVDLSRIRFNEVLCREHFAARKARR